MTVNMDKNISPLIAQDTSGTPAEPSETSCWDRLVKWINCCRHSPSGEDSRPDSSTSRRPIFTGDSSAADNDFDYDKPGTKKRVMFVNVSTFQVCSQSCGHKSESPGSQDEIASQHPAGQSVHSANTIPMVTDL